MLIEKFEDIFAWQKSQALVIGIYALMKTCRDYSFKDQVQRASISIWFNQNTVTFNL
ncbi:MAG: four helix bundle protein [Candidatus Magasanikbacteria bacterium]|nr:four helix bundle protein [Candidatus Magasanikbacteria bacterium]